MYSETNNVDISDVNSEAGVVATVIVHPEYVFYSETLSPHHFTNEANGYLYFAITKLAQRDINTIDAYNIINILRSSKALKDSIDDILSISVINDFIKTAHVIARETVEEYRLVVDNVIKAAFKRNMYAKLEECKAMCLSDNDDDIESKIYNSLDDVMMEYSASADMPQYKDVVDSLWDTIKANQNGETGAIDFPFKLLNQYVKMEPGELVCFSAPQKTGKSAILLTCTVDLLKKGKSVLYIDSELSSRLFTQRLLSHLTKIKFSDIRDGTYSKEDEERINRAIEWIKTRNFIHIYLPEFDENTMYLNAKKAKYLIDIDVIVVDYLKSTSKKDEAYSVYANLGRIADTLKNKITGDMNICGLTACQATSAGKIADSAKIGRSCSTIISIQDKPIEEAMSDGTGAYKKMRVVYNRNGAQMSENEWIDMAFDGSTITYSESKIQHEDIVPY